MSHSAIAHTRFAFAIMLVAGFVLACSDSLNEPSQRIVDHQLVIVTATTGLATDSDGYTIDVSGSAGVSQKVVASNDTVTVGESSGEYTVALGGVSENCVTLGAETQYASLPRDTLVDTLRFRVVCRLRDSGSASITGTIRVISPEAVRPRTITLDRQKIYGATGAGTFTFPNLADGDHLVTIEGEVFGGPVICNLWFDDQTATVHNYPEYDSRSTQSLVVTISGGAAVPVYFVYDCY